MSKKKKSTKKKQAVQCVLAFRQTCDKYGISHNNVYSCMEELQKRVKDSHGKLSFEKRRDFQTILDAALNAPKVYFDRYCDLERNKISDFDTDDCSAAKNVLNYEKKWKKRETTPEQTVIAMYVGCLKKKMETESTSPVKPEDKKLADAIIRALRFQFADVNEVNGKKQFDQLISMDSDTLSERTIKYSAAFDLFDIYLPQYISDGCFIALLPYFIFYHMAYAAKLIKEHSFQKGQRNFSLWKLPLNRIMLSDDYTSYTIQSIPWNENYYKKSGSNKKLNEEEKLNFLDEEATSIFEKVMECLDSVFDGFNTQTLGSYTAKILTESVERLMLDLPIRLRHLHSTYFVTAYYPLSKILPVISKRFNLTPEEEAFLTEKWFEYFYKRVCGKGLSANKQKEFFKQWNHDGQKIPDKLAQVLESLIILENPTEYFRCNIRKENSPYRFETD